MSIVIRADASVNIGSGHIMRCLVLANQLKIHGHHVRFACLPQKGDMIAFIEQKGFEVIQLTPPKKIVQLRYESDYAGWLLRSVMSDALDFLAFVNKADLVVTDHYAIDCEWQAIVRAKLGCKILAIDDLCRQHAADIILDQTLGRIAEEYSSEGRVLTGCDYALLNPQFRQLREHAFGKALSAEALRILVSMGGVDKPNATLQVLRQLREIPHFSTTVLLSPKAPHYAEVKLYCEQHPQITHIDFCDDMAGLMLQSDIAIGAPGTSSWERACLGLPSIIVPLADNQAEIARQLVKYKAVLCMTLDRLQTNLLDCLQRLCDNWAVFHESNLRLCDGLGVFRVALEAEQLLLAEGAGLSLQRASVDDIPLIYEWQCHPATRKYALNPATPDWDEHVTWMQKKLQRYQDYFYILSCPRGKKVGVVRLDYRKEGHYLVSVFIDPSHYGKGIGRQGLQIIDRVHGHVTLHATVLKENVASQRLFESLGYLRENPEKFIRPPIE